MRKFGTDKPEYMTFTLGDSDEVYKIPLAASMPVAVLQKMGSASEGEQFDVQLEMLRSYMGDVVDTITAATMKEILNEWQTASAEQGATTGEL